MPKLKILKMMACVSSLAVASCTTSAVVTEPCDILVDIPKAPAHVNRILIKDARPTAEGIAKNQLRLERFKCRVVDKKVSGN